MVCLPPRRVGDLAALDPEDLTYTCEQGPSRRGETLENGANTWCPFVATIQVAAA